MSYITDALREASGNPRYSELVTDVVRNTPFMKSLDTDMYTDMVNAVGQSVSTDIIQTTYEELSNFATFWKGLDKVKDTVKNTQIPGDIILEGTIPIMDMKIEIEHEGKISDVQSIRVIIFEDVAWRIAQFSMKKYKSVAVGAIVATPIDVVFPLFVGLDNECIEIASTVACLKYSKREYDRRYHLITPDLKEYTLANLGSIMPAWYGMQVALLHPATREVFAHPKKEKRDRKEQLKPVIINGVPKRVKYVKKHVITPENGIYPTLENSMKIMNESRPKGEKRKYERHTYIWRVIGHHATIHGKKTWIKPYWKGPLKDFAGDVRINPNNRDIEIDEEGMKDESNIERK